MMFSKFALDFSKQKSYARWPSSYARPLRDTRSERPVHHGVYGVYMTSDASRLPNP